MAIGIGGQKIITKGLCGPACQGLITTHFSLYCTGVVSPPSFGGGPYPEKMGASNQFDRAQDIFQPVNKDIYDPDRVYKVKKQVVIKVELGNFHMEKIYVVPIERANGIVKVLNLLNTTKDKITINVKKMRRVLHRIKMSVYNLRRKGKNE